MRDPNRINKVLSVLGEKWKMVPDWRFGQLMINVLGEMPVDPFFPEDDKMIEYIEWYFDRSKPDPFEKYKREANQNDG